MGAARHPAWGELAQGSKWRWTRGPLDRFGGVCRRQARPTSLRQQSTGPTCGQPLARSLAWMPGVLTRFGKRLRDLHIQHLRTQINSPWTNGKIEAFWDILQAEVLDRQRFASFAEAEAALAAFAGY